MSGGVGFGAPSGRVQKVRPDNPLAPATLARAVGGAGPAFWGSWPKCAQRERAGRRPAGGRRSSALRVLRRRRVGASSDLFDEIGLSEQTKPEHGLESELVRPCDFEQGREHRPLRPSGCDGSPSPRPPRDYCQSLLGLPTRVSGRVGVTGLPLKGLPGGRRAVAQVGGGRPAPIGRPGWTPHNRGREQGGRAGPVEYEALCASPEPSGRVRTEAARQDETKRSVCRGFSR